MILSEFMDKMKTVMPERNVFPDNAQMSEYIYRALKRIAKDTVPLRLRTTDLNVSILRKLDDLTYIRFPFQPFNDDDDIDIDEALLDAAAYYVASELEPQKKGHYLNKYDREIMLNNERLIETDLDTCTNMNEWGTAWV